jgi:hypothetical protein
MRTRLLSHSDLERFAQEPAAINDEQSPLLCTIMEPVQVADAVIKCRLHLNWTEFLTGWRRIMEGGRLSVIPLDGDCLNRALFERSDSHVVTGLWVGACDRMVAPDRTIRRLILRPSGQNWWEDDLYDEMEAWYGEEVTNA